MKKLGILNIILSIILLVILLFSSSTKSFIYIMSLSLIIGWIFPYLTLLLTGIVFIKESHIKLISCMNGINVILIGFICYLLYSLMKSVSLIMVEYLIMMIISIINSIAINKKYFSYKEENAEIKRIKKNNNGIIK